MKVYVFIIAVSLILGGCATRPYGQLKSLKTGPDEVIVIGKLKVQENGKDVTKETSLLFNEIMWGTYAYRADTSGYLYTKFRRGENHLARIGLGERFSNIPDDFATVMLTDATKVHYIGDITIDITGKLHIMAGMMFGMVGAIADAASSGSRVPITVANDPQPSIDYFRKKFPNSIEVVNSPLTIKSDTVFVK